MGSPAQHSKAAREFEGVAGEDIARAKRSTGKGRCTQALMDLLGARMAIGAAASESSWTDEKRNRTMSDLFRDHTQATIAFEQACLRER